MDLSLVPKLPPPESKAVRFVYPRKRKALQNLRSLLIALIAILVVTRKLYLRSYATERLLWDDYICICAILGVWYIQRSRAFVMVFDDSIWENDTKEIAI